MHSKLPFLDQTPAHVLSGLGCLDDFGQAAQLGNIRDLTDSGHQFAACLAEFRFKGHSYNLKPRPQTLLSPFFATLFAPFFSTFLATF